MIWRRHCISLWLILPFCGSAALAEDVPRSVEGLPLVHWKYADQYFGQEAVVYGKVVLTNNIDYLAFLNFHEDFRNHFTVVIRKESFGNFPEPPERMYHNKRIAVRGQITRYKNKPEIVITSPRQVIILPAETIDPVAALKNKIPRGAEADDTTQPAPSGGRLTIATINLAGVFNLNDNWCHSNKDDSVSPNPKQSAAARLIKQFNADIVAVQHAGTSNCLNRFNQILLSELSYQHVIGFENPATGTLDTALLSRLPVTGASRLVQSDSQTGESVSFKFPPLKVELALESGSRMTVVVVSWSIQADRMKRSAYQAEVKGLGQYVDGLLSFNPDAKLLLCGGFAEKVIGGNIKKLISQHGAGLAVPGYAAPQDEKANQPLIAQVENFILASPSMSKRYVSGSTRIEQDQELPPAVAVSFQVVGRASPSLVPETVTDDREDDF